MVEELKKAQKYIYLEYFIIEEGIMWNTILDILEEKVKLGVDVRVMYDDVGCIFNLPSHYADSLRKKGIKCVVFNRYIIPRFGAKKVLRKSDKEAATIDLYVKKQ